MDDSWRDRALCAQVGGDMFFPEKGGSSAAAKAICGMCRVGSQCEAFAVETGQSHGIWNGKSVRELRRLRRDAA